MTEIVEDFSAEQYARKAASSFTLAAFGHDVLFNSVQGLNCVLHLTNHPDVSTVSEAAVDAMMDAARASTPILAERIASILSAEHAGVGMGAAMGLILLFGKSQEYVTSVTSLPMVMDRIDYTSVLASELDIIVRRASIEARGDVLRRGVLFRQFEELQPDAAMQAH
ncbi:hypothetical protein [Tardiphaga sp.]|jgi:hypothetical protein|uniref:hypothetical protein n=1 Tax=Tardiphaga sp. TaxID=1926292 RepID=UPI0037D9EA3B